MNDSKQAEAFADQTANREQNPSIVMHNRDSKFSKEFKQKLEDSGIRTNRPPKASPNLNGRTVSPDATKDFGAAVDLYRAVNSAVRAQNVVVQVGNTGIPGIIS